MRVLAHRKEDPMKCREYEREIPLFIHDKMDYIRLKRFVKHTNSCPACREELVIAFLMEKGLAKLEAGDAFDLQKELQVHIDIANKKIKRHDNFLKIGYVFEIICFALIAAGLAWIFM
jgi:hypothetical protein